jgi:hypothetical protein
MNTPELHKLALACSQGASNVRAIVRELSSVLDEIPRGQYRDSLDLKIVIGQLSYLVGDSLGPNATTIKHFRQQFKIRTDCGEHLS